MMTHKTPYPFRSVKSLSIQAVPVLRDNYSWLIWREGRVIIIDPGEAAPIKKLLEATPHFQAVEAILITHHHHDHVGGVEELMQIYPMRLYGPENIVPKAEFLLHGMEILSLLSYKIHVFPTPGHAIGHLSYYFEEIPALFSGDVLFSGGCGRLLEGTAEELFHSLRLYDALPQETLLCAGHEYTEANLKFIAHYKNELGLLEGQEVFFRQYCDYVRSLRQESKATLPSCLAIERVINPFLLAKTIEDFAKLRALKDHF